MRRAARSCAALRKPAAQGAAAQRGFTLTEVIFVVLILGVLSFTALSRLSDRDEIKASGFAEQMATTVRWAQKAAVAQRRLVYVNIDPSGGRLYACLDAAPACAQPLAAPFGGNLAISTPARVTLSGTPTQFSFDGLGRPSIAANLELRAVASNGEQHALVIERDSGYVRRS